MRERLQELTKKTQEQHEQVIKLIDEKHFSNKLLSFSASKSDCERT